MTDLERRLYKALGDLNAAAGRVQTNVGMHGYELGRSLAALAALADAQTEAEFVLTEFERQQGNDDLYRPIPARFPGEAGRA